NLWRHADPAQRFSQALLEIVHRARRAKHPDREQDCHHVWDDPHRCRETVLGAFHESLVHAHATDQAVNRQADKNRRDNEDCEQVHPFSKAHTNTSARRAPIRSGFDFRYIGSQPSTFAAMIATTVAIRPTTTIGIKISADVRPISATSDADGT